MSSIEFGGVGLEKSTTFSNLKVGSIKEEQAETSQKKDTISISDEAKGLAAKEKNETLKNVSNQFMSDNGRGPTSITQTLLED